MGEKIRMIRELKGYSQEYVGKRLGISQQEYSKIESGRTEVSFERLQLLASIFDVDPLKIAEFDGSPIFHSTNQKGGGYSNNFYYQSATHTELLDRINQLLSENIQLKEELAKLKGVTQKQE